MKKSPALIIFFLLTGVFSARSQSLQGTQWKSFFGGRINDTATLNFIQDTSYITSSNHMILVRSVFQTSHDTVSINDIGGPIACLDSAGIYKFSNLRKILKLTIIHDPCDGRANSLSGREWIKVEKP